MVGHLLFPDVPERLAAAQTGGVLLDRHGEILRLFPDDRGDFSWPLSPDEFPLLLRQAFLAAEDKRFFTHTGYDPSAILRAAGQNFSGGRIVSGASTITQQLIRICIPRRRTVWNKLRELLMAVSLEQRFSKSHILTAYLNNVPMGGNLRGVGLASLAYLRKIPERLSVAEAAFLAAIPQSPQRVQHQSGPHWKSLLHRRNTILSRMRLLGFITPDEEARARQTELRYRKHSLPFRAPHFVDWITARHGAPRGPVSTSVDISFQRSLEKVLAAHQDRLDRSGARQAAGLILKTSTMEVLAMAGSFGYSRRFMGYNNGCLAPRSGGSVLKPFLYALAMEQGYSPSTTISDTKRTFQTLQGDYLPFNADRLAYGPVTLRTALGNSLNISAVKMLNMLGLTDFHELLVQLGLLADHPDGPRHFGLGLAIGNPEIRMIDLAEAYGTLAHSGFRVFSRTDPGSLRRGEPLFSPQTAFLILDILSDSSARLLSFGNPQHFKFNVPIAIKTGTSTNYRDSWLCAVHPEYLLFFWVGNFDGSPTTGLFGSAACGPLLYDLVNELGLNQVFRWFPRPPGLVERSICGISGQSPTAWCPKISQDLFIESHPAPLPCSFHTDAAAGHLLAPEYSNWLFQRRQHHIADPYSLAGEIELSDPFQASGYLAPLAGSVQFRDDSATRSVGSPGASGTSMISAVSPGLAGFPNSPASSYRSSARSEGRWIVAQPPSVSSGFGGIRIVSPHDGDRLILGPGSDNLLILRAVPDEPLLEITWLIDGRELARTSPPYEALWPMERGRHLITAIGAGEEAAQVHILVE